MARWYRFQVPRELNESGSRVIATQTVYIWANHQRMAVSRLGIIPGQWRGISGTRVDMLTEEEGERMIERAMSNNENLSRKKVKDGYLIWKGIYGAPI